MLEWEVTADGLEYPRASAPIRVTGDFASSGSGCDIDHPTTTTAGGTATTLRIPAGPTALRTRDGWATDLPVGTEQPVPVGGASVITRLPTGDAVAVGFRSSATVRRQPGERSVVSFPDRVDVGIGYREPSQPASIPVDPTPTGLAEAVSLAARRHPTTGAARSIPALRAPAPSFRPVDTDGAPVYEDYDASVTDRARPTIQIPPKFDAVLASAPLSFYAGATLRVTSGTAAVIRTQSGQYEFDDPIDGPQTLLERLVWLDTLVRESGDTTLTERSLLERLELNPPVLRAAPTVQRLERYLSANYDAIRDSLPDWHLVTYADPSPESIPAVPGLLDRLSHIAEPVAHELSGRELMERTLDDFYRASQPPAPEPGNEARTPVDLVDPELRPGQLHGWLADGAPLDVYKAIPGVYDGTRSVPGEDAISITVVRNEEEMAGEEVDAVKAYRSTPKTSVRLKADLGTDALRETIEAGPDLLHFVGHCDAAGLRCPDGHLPADSFDRCPTRTLFLNACGSYHEGLAFVERGAMAVGVTYRKVLDAQARTVGAAFARLFVAGFPIELAIEAARRRIAMGKDYAIVGDGTHTLHAEDAYLPILLAIDRENDETYHVRSRRPGVPQHGGTYRPPYDDGRHLRGAPAMRTLTREELLKILTEYDGPVQFEDELVWTDTLLDRLGETS